MIMSPPSSGDSFHPVHLSIRLLQSLYWQLLLHFKGEFVKTYLLITIWRIAYHNKLQHFLRRYFSIQNIEECWGRYMFLHQK